MGYEDVNDHITLRKDLGFQTAINSDDDLASSSTLSRFENSITRNTVAEINKTFVETFIASFKKAPKELVLDFDPTDDPIHGHQENRHYNGYYESYCYLPSYVFCGEQLLVSYLRPCNIDGAKHAWAILSLLVKRFRQKWPEVKIIFRGDSGFCRNKMLEWCDKHDVGYIVGTALAKAQCGTIRLKLIKIGAVIIRNTRRIKFLLSSSYPYQDRFCKIHRKLCPE